MKYVLDDTQIQRFIQDGFVRINQAFPIEVAQQGRDILWADTGVNAHDPSTWTKPVIRLGDYGQAPFQAAVNSPQLQAAYDQLVGVGRWLPRNSLGTFPIRFPSTDDPDDAGWHIDASFALPQDDPIDYLSWRANISSKGRALLMLFLFSDVGEKDAPTRIRVGSHLDIAKRLAPAGEKGLTLRDLAHTGFSETAHREEARATGPAGTVYLCHPFLVHGAQAHHGSEPRFMAQPPLLPAQPFEVDRADEVYSPVEQAIRLGLRVN